MRGLPVLPALLVLGLAGSSAVAQETPPGEDRCLTLDEAVQLALEGNRSLHATRARARAAELGVATADAFLWPGVRGEAGFTRSDDPVAAFGTRLRQSRFTEQDFALDALNHPDAVSDWSGGLGVSWGALDPAAWAGRHVARARSRAASLGADRREDAVVYETRVLYLDAVRVRARLAAAESGEAAATATRDLLARREREGLVTRADVLRAEAALADARARRVDAERMVEDARARLALHLGMDPTTPLVPVDTVALASAPAVPAAPTESLADRPDVRAAGALVDAARAEARQAGMSRLPTVELYGALSTHAPGAFDERETHATLGVQLRVPLFTGGALSARQEAAEALARAADLDRRDALARARAELDESARALEAAGEALVAATAAADAAEEASRLTRRRFQEGLATTADLLQAEAEATRLRTAAVDARARVQIARAAVAFALGATTEPPGGLDR